MTPTQCTTRNNQIEALVYPNGLELSRIPLAAELYASNYATVDDAVWLADALMIEEWAGAGLLSGFAGMEVGDDL